LHGFNLNSEEPKPFAQYGSSESVISATWVSNAPCILAGMGYKWIRIYDIRGKHLYILPIAPETGQTTAISTKSVQGITADPYNSHRFASFGDDEIVRIWDLRKVNEPVICVYFLTF
jgi:WD40 repeat protein